MKEIQKWKLLSEKDVSPSKWFPLFERKYEMPNGKIVDPFYVSKLGDVAKILPITKDKKIVFVRQYKPGADKICLELPAGRVKPNQTPLEAAKAELEEETGILSDNFKDLGVSIVESTKGTVHQHNFLVLNAEFNSKQNFDETEDIEVVLHDIAEVYEYMLNGEIDTCETITTIKLAELKYPEVFK